MSRISKYEEWERDGELADKLILIEGWARDGLTQEQIANNLDINPETLIEYKKKYIEFSNAIKKGQEVVDFEVENALLKSALGYTVTLNEQKVTKDGDVVDTVKEVHMPPNPTSIIFWLKNRKKKQWRDRVLEEGTQEEINKVKELLDKIDSEANK